MSSHRPPRFWWWLLGRLGKDSEHLRAEMSVLFQNRIEMVGARGARRWYRLQVIGLLGAAAFDRTGVIMARMAAGLVSLFTDLKYSIRRLFRRPGYLVAAALTLSAGVGGLTTVYAVANWVLLRPVPGIPEPESIAVLRVESNDESWPTSFAWPISHPDLVALRSMIPGLSDIAGGLEQDVHLNLGNDRGSIRTVAQVVTPNFFDVIGLAPHIGRTFSASTADDTRNAVVIGYGLWQRIWNGDPGALGQQLTVNANTFTVIGITPRGFRGAELPGSTDLWLASSSLALIHPEGGADLLQQRGRQLWSQTLGRIKPNVTIEQVEDQANAAIELIRRDARTMHSFAASHFVYRAYREPGLSPWIRSTVARTLAILAGAGALLLSLALANIGNLSLARLSSRRTELAIRRSLGCSTWRVAREPLLEAFVVGITGGTGGIVLSVLGVRLFGHASLSYRGASLEGLRLEWGVVAVALACAILTSLIASLVPALSAARNSNRIQPHDPGRGYSTPRIRSGLAIAQVALSAMLVVGAGLLVRTAINLRGLDLGFRPDNLTTFSIEPRLQGYDAASQSQLVQRVHDALVENPGIVSAGFLTPPPLRGWRVTAPFYPEGKTAREDISVGTGFDVTRGTLTTMGFDFIAGTDDAPARNTIEVDSGYVVLNRAAAEAAFPDRSLESLVGRTINTPHPDRSWIIAGVVEQSRIISVTNEDGAIMFRLIHDISGSEELVAYVRTDGTATGIEAITQVMREVAPDVPPYGLGTAQDQIAQMLNEQLVLARLGTVLALTGLFLAAIGLYGVLSYGVTERTREIGVRSALGATPGRILRSVVMKGIAMASAGVVLGVPAVYWIVALIESRLYDVSAFDGTTYSIGAVMILLAAMLASAVPAIRALAISPTEALREN